VLFNVCKFIIERIQKENFGSPLQERECDAKSASEGELLPYFALTAWKERVQANYKASPFMRAIQFVFPHLSAAP